MRWPASVLAMMLLCQRALLAAPEPSTSSPWTEAIGCGPTYASALELAQALAAEQAEVVISSHAQLSLEHGRPVAPASSVRYVDMIDKRASSVLTGQRVLETTHGPSGWCVKLGAVVRPTTSDDPLPLPPGPWVEWSLTRLQPETLASHLPTIATRLVAAMRAAGLRVAANRTLPPRTHVLPLASGVVARYHVEADLSATPPADVRLGPQYAFERGFQTAGTLALRVVDLEHGELVQTQLVRSMVTRSSPSSAIEAALEALLGDPGLAKLFRSLPRDGMEPRDVHLGILALGPDPDLTWNALRSLRDITDFASIDIRSASATSAVLVARTRASTYRLVESLHEVGPTLGLRLYSVTNEMVLLGPSDSRAGGLTLITDRPTDVKLDGLNLGRTPIVLPSLPAADYFLELSSSGTPPTHQRIRVQAGVMTKLNYPSVPNSGPRAGPRPLLGSHHSLPLR